MSYRDKINLLREHGFEYVRRVTHGELWRREKATIIVPRQTRGDDPRACKNWLCAFRKLIQS